MVTRLITADGSRVLPSDIELDDHVCRGDSLLIGKLRLRIPEQQHVLWTKTRSYTENGVARTDWLAIVVVEVVEDGDPESPVRRLSAKKMRPSVTETETSAAPALEDVEADELETSSL